MENIKRGAMEISNQDTIIACLWYEQDYGVVLSSFALYKVLENLGASPILLSNSTDELQTDHADKQNVAFDFIYKNCLVADAAIPTDELEKCRNYVTGSYYTWDSVTYDKKANGFFFGGTVSKNIKRISYASSFGLSQPNDMEKDYIHKFKQVSIRNAYDKQICQTEFSMDAYQALDPVFLCEGCVYENLVNNKVINHPYIFTDIKHNNKRIRRFIETGMRIKKYDSLNYAEISFMQKEAGLKEEEDQELLANSGLLLKEINELKKLIMVNSNTAYKESDVDNEPLKLSEKIEVEDWLFAIKNSEYVVTDSYYGACFAIIFHKPFAAIILEEYQVAGELKELLNLLGLEERIVPCNYYNDLQDYTYLYRKEINYMPVNKKLDLLRTESLIWLQKALEE